MNNLLLGSSLSLGYLSPVGPLTATISYSPQAVNKLKNDMRKIITLVAIFFSLMPLLSAQQDTLTFDENAVSEDSVEYELIIIDPGFESFLVTQKSKEFYSQSYYENWNQRYVTEWNYRHSQPLTYGDMYETYIDYSPHIDYGLELNYKLFYYFRYFEKKYGVKLLP